LGEAYQIQNQDAVYFLTFQVVGWADVFSREIYREIVLESFKYCIEEKGLIVHAFVVMTNHVHCVLRSSNSNLSDTVRDLKRFTSSQILKEIRNNPKESRRDWLMMVFKYHSKFNKRTTEYQFWTHENHAVELDANHMIDSRVNYIHNNPC